VPLFARLLRAGETKLVKRLGKIAAHIDTLEADVQALTDAELRGEDRRVPRRFADGESLDELLPEAFAVVREGRSARSASATSRCR
jgi:preprotein translocase subunit SecA